MAPRTRELTMVPLGGARWQVISQRGEEVAAYLVDPNRLACDCASGARGRACEHLRFVLAYLTGASEVMTTAAPAEIATVVPETPPAVAPDFAIPEATA